MLGEEPKVELEISEVDAYAPNGLPRTSRVLKRETFGKDFGDRRMETKFALSFDQREFTVVVVGLGANQPCPAMLPATSDTSAASLYNELARTKGCSQPTQLPISPACEPLAALYVECLRDDLSQCACESGSGKLNCEGGHKSSEGPAKCVSRYQDLIQCTKR
jgi:hypothetical protein